MFTHGTLNAGAWSHTLGGQYYGFYTSQGMGNFDIKNYRNRNIEGIYTRINAKVTILLFNYVPDDVSAIKLRINGVEYIFTQYSNGRSFRYDGLIFTGKGDYLIEFLN